jgi:hypothetical protein
MRMKIMKLWTFYLDFPRLWFPSRILAECGSLGTPISYIPDTVTQVFGGL